MSSFLCEGFLQLRQVGATLHRGAQASHHRGLSCCGAQAPDAQAQQLWLTGLVAPWHVGSSQTRARTRVPRIGRRTLNHCATREAPSAILKQLHLAITQATCNKTAAAIKFAIKFQKKLLEKKRNYLRITKIRVTADILSTVIEAQSQLSNIKSCIGNRSTNSGQRLSLGRERRA